MTASTEIESDTYMFLYLAQNSIIYVISNIEDLQNFFQRLVALVRIFKKM